MRVWDCLMVEGSVVLFKVALAMLTLRVTTLTDLDEHGPIFNALSEIPSGMLEPELLMKLAFSFMHIEPELAGLRGKHRAAMEAELLAMQELRKRRHDIRAAAKLEAGSSGSVSEPVLDQTDILVSTRDEIVLHCVEVLTAIEQQFCLFEREGLEEQREKERLRKEVEAFLAAKAANVSRPAIGMRSDSEMDPGSPQRADSGNNTNSVDAVRGAGTGQTASAAPLTLPPILTPPTAEAASVLGASDEKDGSGGNSNINATTNNNNASGAVSMSPAPATPVSSTHSEQAKAPFSPTVVGDEKRNPRLRTLVDDLAVTLGQVISHGGVAQGGKLPPHAWDIVEFVCGSGGPKAAGAAAAVRLEAESVASATSTPPRDVATLSPPPPLHSVDPEVADAIRAAVDTARLLAAGINTVEGINAKMQALVRIGLNKGCLSRWMQHFAAVAMQYPSGDWHKPQAVIRIKNITIKIVAGLERLDSKAFKLVVSNE